MLIKRKKALRRKGNVPGRRILHVKLKALLSSLSFSFFFRSDASIFLIPPGIAQNTVRTIQKAQQQGDAPQQNRHDHITAPATAHQFFNHKKFLMMFS